MKISKSKINTYTKCPREFKYIYIDHLYNEPNQYMQLGLDVHKIAEKIGAELKTKADVTEDDVLKAFENNYIESEFDLTKHMESLYSFFCSVFASNLKIVNVEEDIYDEDFNIRGIVDLVLEDIETEDLYIVDYKTSKTKPITKYRLELCMYRKLIESKYPGRTVISAIIFFTKDGGYRGFSFTNAQKKGARVTDEDYDAVFTYIDFIKDKIDKKIFPPKKQYLCQYCRFNAKCNEDGGF